MAGHLADDLMAVARTFGCRSQPVRHVNVVAVPNSTGASLPVWCRTRSACARDGAHGASEQRLTRIDVSFCMGWRCSLLRSLTFPRILVYLLSPLLASPLNRHVYHQDQETVQRLADAAQLGQAQLGAARRALHHDQEHQRTARAGGPTGTYVGGSNDRWVGWVGVGFGTWCRGRQGGSPSAGEVRGGGALPVRRRALCEGRGCTSARWPRRARRLRARANSCRLVRCRFPRDCRVPSAPSSSPRSCSRPSCPPLSRRQTWPTSLCGWRKSQRSTPRRHGTPTACGWYGSTCRLASWDLLSSPRSFGRSGRGGEVACRIRGGERGWAKRGWCTGWRPWVAEGVGDTGICM